MDQLYRDAVEYMNEEYPFWLTNVLNIGAPEWDTNIPTACVALEKDEEDTSKFRFMFNPEFAAKLTVPEMAFVLSHETMHIILDHLSLAKSDKYDPKRLNIAEDCIINDWLVSTGMTPPEGALRGLDVVGFDCASATIDEVYRHLPDDETTDEQWEQAKEATGDHDWLDEEPEMTEDMAEALGEASIVAADIFEDVEPTSFDMYTDGISEREFAAEADVSLEWAKLLARINPDILQKPARRHAKLATWNRPSRRLMSVYPTVILPVTEYEDPKTPGRHGDMPQIVMFIDASGSVTEDQVQKFVTLARSVPRDKIDLILVAAATSAEELDVNDLANLTGRSSLPNVGYGDGEVPGMTSYGDDYCVEFIAMQAWLRKALETGRLTSYPKSVVVISDGQTGLSKNHITQEQAQAWTLLLDNTRGYHGQNKSTPEALWNGLLRDSRSLFSKEQVYCLSDFTKKS